jgi:ubiquinone/menaquinone biosynthesis C-methylase UbiE
MSALEGLAKIFGGDEVGWIHDGVMGEERLRERGDGYIRLLFDPYPDLKLKPNFRALEIGSGVGYIMQALARYGYSHGVPADRIIGLDIAAPMLEKAKARVGSGPPYEFLHYDGVHVPLEDASLDFIYSVASLQHIPKEYVFNLFFEIKRLLSATGFSLFHLLNFDHISDHHRPGSTPSWEEMVRSQIKSDGRGQWMHFYSENELHQVLGAGTGFADVRVTKVHGGSAFSVAVSDAPRLSARQDASQERIAELEASQKANLQRIAELEASQEANLQRIAELEASQEASRRRLSAEVDALRSKETALGAEVDALQRQNAASASALNSLRNSTTWKLVSPLWRLETRGQRKARRRNTSSSSGSNC